MYRLCRSCLESVSKTYPLVGNIANVDINVVDMLEYCTSQKLDLNDDLPKDVCPPCFKSIRIMYNFLKQFEESQLKLQEQLSLKINSEEYESNQSTSTSDQPTESNHIHYDLESIHNYAVKLENSDTTQVAELTDYAQITEIFTEDDNAETPSSDNCDSHIKLEVEEPPLNWIKPESAEGSVRQNQIDYIQFNNDSTDGKEVNSAVKYMMLQSPEGETPIVVELEKDLDVHATTVCYRCPLCKLSFWNCKKFASHVYSHHTKTIICKWCPSKAHVPIDDYLNHYKRTHKYQCSICEKSLTSSYGYRYHMKQHGSVKNYKCPVENCLKSFLLFNLLKRHIMEKHSDNKRYKCDKCDAAYSSYDTFRYHKKTHEGIKAHLCTVCGKGFYQAVHLRDHMYRHMGKKMFTCDLCGFSVVTNSQLKKHQKYCNRKNGSNRMVVD